MEFGGNKLAKAYFEKNDLFAAGQHNYALPQAAKYRTELAKKAEAAAADLQAKMEVPEPEANVDVEETKTFPEVPAPKAVPIAVLPVENNGKMGFAASKYILK